MKNIYKQIAQAYLLERLSPASYEQMVDLIKAKRRVNTYTQEDLLRGFDIPYAGNTQLVGKQFKKTKDVIAARIKLDEEINKMLQDCPMRYTQYEH